MCQWCIKDSIFQKSKHISKCLCKWCVLDDNADGTDEPETIHNVTFNNSLFQHVSSNPGESVNSVNVYNGDYVSQATDNTAASEDAPDSSYGSTRMSLIDSLSLVHQDVNCFEYSSVFYINVSLQDVSQEAEINNRNRDNGNATKDLSDGKRVQVEV